MREIEARAAETAATTALDATSVSARVWATRLGASMGGWATPMWSRSTGSERKRGVKCEKSGGGDAYHRTCAPNPQSPTQSRGRVTQRPRGEVAGRYSQPPGYLRENKSTVFTIFASKSGGMRDVGKSRRVLPRRRPRHDETPRLKVHGCGRRGWARAWAGGRRKRGAGAQTVRAGEA